MVRNAHDELGTPGSHDFVGSFCFSGLSGPSLEGGPGGPKGP